MEFKYENPGRVDIVYGPQGGVVATQVIFDKRLPFYQKAALETGFKVEKLANEGDKFDSLRTPNGILIVRDSGAIEKGCIAVSIESKKSESSGDKVSVFNFEPFWKALEKFEGEDSLKKNIIEPTTESTAKS